VYLKKFKLAARFIFYKFPKFVKNEIKLKFVKKKILQHITTTNLLVIDWLPEFDYILGIVVNVERGSHVGDGRGRRAVGPGEVIVVGDRIAVGFGRFILSCHFD